MQDLRIETVGGVMVITLDRAAKKNSVTDAMYGGIAAALNAAAADDAVRVAVITGDGPDFCAGNDISMFARSASGEEDIGETNVRPFLTALSTFPKPLIAAVTGRAIGVGTTLLLHCDLIYIADDAQLIAPFIDLGLVPEAAAGRLLPERMGHVRAFGFLALGERIGGGEAVALGLANAALPAAEVLPAAMAAARTLAGKPPSAVAATKRLMRDAEAIAAAMTEGGAAFVQQLASPEAAAAFAAFAARKTPAA